MIQAIMRWLITLAVCLTSSFSSALAQDTDGAIVDPAPPPPAAYLVLFDPESAELTGAAKFALDGLLRDYKVLKPSVVHVNGYYDRSATEDYADRISRKMAEAVRDYLISNGVAADTITLGWYGEHHPLVQTADAVAEAANRSVEILFDSRKNPLRL